jgi:hypothetical protein
LALSSPDLQTVQLLESQSREARSAKKIKRPFKCPLVVAPPPAQSSSTASSASSASSIQSWATPYTSSKRLLAERSSQAGSPSTLFSDPPWTSSPTPIIRRKAAFKPLLLHAPTIRPSHPTPTADRATTASPSALPSTITKPPAKKAKPFPSAISGKASTPFKSPLPSSSPYHRNNSQAGSGGSSEVTGDTTREVRELERKIQILKQALRFATVEGQYDEERQEELVKKWVGIGREV